MKQIFSNKYMQYGLLVLAGLILGWIFFHRPQSVKEETHDHSEHAEESTVWTCSMHPQIRMDKPGKCPLCAMDLIPLSKGGATVDADAIQFTDEAVALANIQTSVVTVQKPEKEVRLYGKLQADERLQQSQVAHVPGRIESLRVNFTGETVRKGQMLATVYSPELVTARQELLEASKSKHLYPELHEAARERLRQWKLTDSQIDDIENGKNVTSTIDITANTSGIVTSRRVNTGDYVAVGTVLFEIADLSSLWAMFDAYETDLPFIHVGDKLAFTVQAVPGETFTGRVAFIDPVLNPATRTAKVRVETSNASRLLKPEMFATGIVNASLKSTGDMLAVPRSAVLWTGKRSIVYVKQTGSEAPVFKLREIELGPSLGNSYMVMSGLNEGEEVVTQGAFSVDAAAQLEGKPSMMNRTEGAASTGHDHGQTQSAPTDANLKHTTFSASGNCEMCKERIEQAAKSVAGVKSAEWDSGTRQVHVQFDGTSTNEAAIQQAIAQSGHDTDKFKAPDAVYKTLPGCCLYRE